ncbi:MAG: hypothetical protein ACKVQA_11935, partial [Burkholderiales bacterium]
DIAHVQAGAGDLAGALETAIQIPSVGDANAVLQHISLSQARKGDIAGALKTAALYSPHSDLRSRVAMVQAERGDLAGALKTASSMEKDTKDYYTRSMVQASFAQAQIRGGNAGGARKTLASARDSAGFVSDAGLKDAVLRHIAHVQAEGGDVAGAMVVTGQIQDAYWKGMTQSDIAEIQAKEGDIAGALKTAGAIQYHDNDMQSGALVRVAEIQAKNSDFAGALRTSRMIPSNDRKAGAQRIIAQLQAQRGELAGAQKTASMIQDVTHQNEAQLAVDTARIEAGDLATLWRQRLDDSNSDHDAALNTSPFLDLPSHLHSVSALKDPKELFQGLYRTCIDMLDAERAIKRMLEKQAI